MLSRLTALELVRQDLELLPPEERKRIVLNPAKMERLVEEKLARIQSRKDLALKRGASEVEAEELAQDGIQAYNPEEARAFQETQRLNGPISEGDALGC